MSEPKVGDVFCPKCGLGGSRIRGCTVCPECGAEVATIAEVREVTDLDQYEGESDPS